MARWSSNHEYRMLSRSLHFRRATFKFGRDKRELWSTNYWQKGFNIFRSLIFTKYEKIKESNKALLEPQVSNDFTIILSQNKISDEKKSSSETKRIVIISGGVEFLDIWHVWSNRQLQTNIFLTLRIIIYVPRFFFFNTKALESPTKSVFRVMVWETISSHLSMCDKSAFRHAEMQLVRKSVKQLKAKQS